MSCTLRLSSMDRYRCGSKPMVPFWGSTTHFRTHFSGDWDVHWGYDLDFHPWPYEKNLEKVVLKRLIGCSAVGRWQHPAFFRQPATKGVAKLVSAAPLLLSLQTPPEVPVGSVPLKLGCFLLPC